MPILIVNTVALAKAKKKAARHPGQMSLFGPSPRLTPTTTLKHKTRATVHTHVRKTKTGLVAVKQHQRAVERVTHPEADPKPEPVVEVEPEPIPEPEPVVEPEETVTEAPINTGPWHYAAMTDASILPEHIPVIEDKPTWQSTGQKWEGVDIVTPTKGQGTIIEARQPLHARDMEHYRLIPVVKEDAGWRRRAVDPQEHSGATRRVFNILRDRWPGFLKDYERLKKKAAKYGMDEPVYRVIRDPHTTKVPIALEHWGGAHPPTVQYGERTSRLIELDAPEMKIKGWKLEAIITPMVGTDRNVINRVGEANLPERYWTTGTHCEHCNTDRARKSLFALHNPENGKWMQCGASCLADFTGMSAARSASNAEFVANWWKDAESLDDDYAKGGGRPEKAWDLNDILLAAVNRIEQDGAYISSNKAYEDGIQSTKDSVREDMAKSPPSNIAGHQDRVDSIMDWLASIPEDIGIDKNAEARQVAQDRRIEIEEETAALDRAGSYDDDELTRLDREYRAIKVPKSTADDYLANLLSIRLANTVGVKELGYAVSAVTAYGRAQERAAKDAARAARPPGKFFGAPGDKIGRKLSKKDRDKGATAHPAHRVKVVGAHSYESEWGGGTILLMRDDQGHTFKWNASGSYDWDNATTLGHEHGFDGNQLRWPQNQVQVGETFDLAGTIKGHKEYRETPQTLLTRVKLSRVFTPDEAAFLKTTQKTLAAEETAKAAKEAAAHTLFTRKWEASGEDSFRPSHAFRESIEEEHPQMHEDHWRSWGPARGYGHTPTTPEEIESNSWEDALSKLKARANDSAHEPLAKAMPGQIEDPDQEPEPAQRVKFKHPDTGDDSEGFIHASGHQGATVIDGEGKNHKIEHGHYMHHKGEEEAPEIDPEHMAQVAEQHLALGPKSKLSVMACAILLTANGIQGAHELQASDVRIKNGMAFVGKKRTDNKAMVAMLGALAQGDGPLFQVDGEQITEDELTNYVTRFGQSEPQALNKASAGAMAISVASDPEKTWHANGFQCEFRKFNGGLGMLTMRGGSLPLPYHEGVNSISQARSTATKMIKAFRDGKIPWKGVFRADGR